MRAQLTTKIPLKDGRGNVTREKEVATFAGLLAKAHEEELKRIETELLQSKLMCSEVRLYLYTSVHTFSSSSLDFWVPRPPTIRTTSPSPSGGKSL